MSTILHEEGCKSAWFETQLAHMDKNAIHGAYNHAQYLEGRQQMMQWYNDYIDGLPRNKLPQFFLQKSSMNNKSS